MVCQSSVGGLALLIEHKVNKIKPGKKSWRQSDVIDNRQLGVVFRVDGVCGSQDGSSCIQGADDTSFGN